MGEHNIMATSAAGSQLMAGSFASATTAAAAVAVAAVVGGSASRRAECQQQASHSTTKPTASSPAEATAALLLPRLVGSGIAGVSELSLFHPVDTIAKRLMSSTATLQQNNINATVFGSECAPTATARLRSLFPGVGFAAAYKVCQRTYKFGLQPVVYEAIDKSSVGSKLQSKALKSAIAGSMLGAGEVALLPLDVLKIKAQTNPNSIRGRGVIEIFTPEGRALYRGAGWTAARNIPGSFALFGGNTAVKQMLGAEPGQATFFQTALSSMGGAIASLVVSQPLDVVKTRVQNRGFDAPESGANIVKNIIREEGPGAFFKGFTPKVMAVGPKLVFSFTIAQQLIQFFESRMAA